MLCGKNVSSEFPEILIKSVMYYLGSFSNKILCPRHDEEINNALEQGKLKKIEEDVPWKVCILFEYLNNM